MCIILEVNSSRITYLKFYLKTVYVRKTLSYKTANMERNANALYIAVWMGPGSARLGRKQGVYYNRVDKKI